MHRKNGQQKGKEGRGCTCFVAFIGCVHFALLSIEAVHFGKQLRFNRLDHRSSRTTIDHGSCFAHLSEQIVRTRLRSATPTVNNLLHTAGDADIQTLHSGKGGDGQRQEQQSKAGTVPSRMKTSENQKKSCPVWGSTGWGSTG